MLAIVIFLYRYVIMAFYAVNTFRCSATIIIMVVASGGGVAESGGAGGLRQ